MTENEIKDFFVITEKDQISYDAIRSTFTDEQIQNAPEEFIAALLKQTYGFPISFFDSGKEDNFTLSEERSNQIYEDFAFEILDGTYEDLYDFTQDFSASLPTE